MNSFATSLKTFLLISIESQERGVAISAPIYCPHECDVSVWILANWNGLNNCIIQLKLFRKLQLAGMAKT